MKENRIEQLRAFWKQEEAHTFKGWDFSYLHGRWDDERIPWDYETILRKYLKNTDHLLDMGTGGGEFLLTLNHPYELTSVTEGYEPNLKICREKLSPLGITVKQSWEDNRLDFADESFDCIIDRHESFEVNELYRTLKPDGIFITQQVGGANDRDLSERLIKDFKPEFPEHTLENNVAALEKAGFEILDKRESFTPIKFFDIGALVYFAKIIEWEFPGFSVDGCFERLLKMQEELEKTGYMKGTEHRFLIVAKKK